MGTPLSRTASYPHLRCGIVLSAILAAAPVTSMAATYSLIVSGLGGEAQYEQRFRDQSQKIAAVAQRLTGDEATTIMLVGADATRDAVRRSFRELGARLTADDQLIVTLLGHGSFDGEQYRFNLPGPDMTEQDLGSLLDALKVGQILIVNATSASGAVLTLWQRPGRILVTATKSGGERTATRFAQFWVEALEGTQADLNKDDIVTAAEAFDYASRKVGDSFKADALLATEHARLEGTGADRFQVARLGAAARVTTDPHLNELFAQRVRIERELEGVKQRKASLTSDAYYDELESVLVRLATLQRDIDAQTVN